MISLKEIIKNILGIINNYLKKMVKEMSEKAIQERFDEKLEELKESLPPLGKDIGTSCAALTFTHVLDVLGSKNFDSVYFNNLAVPFSGFGTYTSKSGWAGPCGTVSGGIAAIGVIMGGQEKLKSMETPAVYVKAAKFASRFEAKYGSVSCKEICGYDLGKPENIKQYVKSRTWEKKCVHFVIYAIDQARKLTKRELKSKWT